MMFEKENPSCIYVIEDENYSKGSYGTIILARDQNDDKIIIKKIERDDREAKYVINEIKSGKILKHPNIIVYQKYFLTPKYHYLIFDLIDGCNLFDLMESLNFEPLREHDLKTMFVQMASVLEYCNLKGIAHRGIIFF